MTCPINGEITVRGIKREIETYSYSITPPFPATYDNSNLTTLSSGEININNPIPNRPNGAAPHNTSEFYLYDADAGGGGGPGKFCFTEDTLVTMADGTTKRIDQIEMGDSILVASGSWPAPSGSGEFSYKNMTDTILWSQTGWSSSLDDCNITYTSSVVDTVWSASYPGYTQFEAWETDNNKNTWEDGYTKTYHILKGSYDHPLFMRPKYTTGRCGDRNDVDGGYVCWKPTNKTGRGDQLFATGSFVTIKTKKYQQQETILYTIKSTVHNTFIANGLLVHQSLTYGAPYNNS